MHSISGLKKNCSDNASPTAFESFVLVILFAFMGIDRFETESKRVGGRVVSHTNILESQRAGELMRLYGEQQDFLKRKPEIAATLNALIDSINLDALHNIFTEYAAKSGVASENVNKISRKKIFLTDSIVDSDEDVAMTYAMVPNAFQINGQIYEGLLTADSTSEKGHFIFLKDFIHENTHATSRNRCVMSDSVFNRKDINISGISERSSMRMIPGFTTTGTDAFKFLNEGITELIAGEALFEYMRQYQWQDVSLGNVPQGLFRNLVANGKYGMSQRIVLLMTGAIAQKTGVSRDVVWRSFVRQYYSGELQTGELSETLSEVFDAKLVDRLRSARTFKDLEDLEFDLFDGSFNTVISWLDHLNMSRGAH